MIKNRTKKLRAYRHGQHTTTVRKMKRRKITHRYRCKRKGVGGGETDDLPPHTLPTEYLNGEQIQLLKHWLNLQNLSNVEIGKNLKGDIKFDKGSTIQGRFNKEDYLITEIFTDTQTCDRKDFRCIVFLAGDTYFFLFPFGYAINLYKCNNNESTSKFYNKIMNYIIDKVSGRFVFFGHSMGCAIALDLYRHIVKINKDMFKQISIMGSAPFPTATLYGDDKLPDDKDKIHIFSTATLDEYPKIILDCFYRYNFVFIPSQTKINMLTSNKTGSSVNVKLIVREFEFSRRDDDDLYFPDYNLSETYKKNFPSETYVLIDRDDDQCQYPHIWATYEERLKIVLAESEKRLKIVLAESEKSQEEILEISRTSQRLSSLPSSSRKSPEKMPEKSFFNKTLAKVRAKFRAKLRDKDASNADVGLK